MGEPLIYLILGCKGTGRFQVVADLIDFGTDKDEKSFVFHSPADAESAEATFDVKSRSAVLAPYGGKEGELSADLPKDADFVFVVADGLASPADSVELFHSWLEERSFGVARVITVLNCELAIESKAAFPWFDCCIHYSDVVLLTQRANVNSKKLKAFQDSYVEKCYPCLFGYVKRGRVANPHLVLEAQSRRISLVFDKPEIFEDDDEEAVFEESVAGDLSKDAYQKRVSGGRRDVVLPDIVQYL